MEGGGGKVNLKILVIFSGSLILKIIKQTVKSKYNSICFKFK